MEKSDGKACGICGKWFSGGKALGGHMRSHMVHLPIAPKLETNTQAVDNSADSTHRRNQFASLQTCLPEIQQTQNFLSMKQNFTASSANSNRENEFVSNPKIPTRKRSNCGREFNAAADTEDMSKDPGVLMVWGFYKDAQKREGIKKQKMRAKDGESSTGDSLAQADSEARFNCERCGKMFRSYQALGGHRVYCKRDNDGDLIDQKPFHCPNCNKVFKSAQALGGHKRVHSSGANEFQSVPHPY